jgi:hypothetical protein
MPFFMSKNLYICQYDFMKDMQNKKKVSTSDKFEGNPRQITEKQLSLLKEHLEELGDLSGVIYCHNNKSYVGGNQRSEVFNGANISIVEKYDKPTKNKTVAHGFIEYNGEKYAYREVMFTEDEFRKACIVANNDGGSFDWDILANSWDAGELEDWGVDIPDEWGVNPDEYGEDFSLPDGDKAPFQQMTFTLADEQAEQVKNAIADIKHTEEYKYAETMGNENSNGNALYLIIMQWAEQRT